MISKKQLCKTTTKSVNECKQLVQQSLFFVKMFWKLTVFLLVAQVVNAQNDTNLGFGLSKGVHDPLVSLCLRI